MKYANVPAGLRGLGDHLYHHGLLALVKRRMKTSIPPIDETSR